ncbi:MAG: SGNH/GDSL hydrolase family protein [Magnetovibrionaceae bacterium]
MFFLSKSKRTEQNKDYDYSLYDPLLGFAHNHQAEGPTYIRQIPGYEVMGAPDDQSPKKVMILGGSTSSRLELCNWPLHLLRLLEAEADGPWQVANGAVGGFGAAQELIKLIRDLPALRPDMVLVLSGINDLGFQWSPPGHPFVHQFQETLARSVSQGAEAFSGYTLGPACETTPAAHWLRMAGLMKAAAGSGVRVFLQPVLGAGAYQPKGSDIDLATEQLAPRTNPDGSSYLAAVDAFYSEVRPRLGRDEYSHIVDLTDLFADEQSIYRDCRHPNDRGNGLIARAIFDHLKSADLL